METRNQEGTIEILQFLTRLFPTPRCLADLQARPTAQKEHAIQGLADQLPRKWHWEALRRLFSRQCDGLDPKKTCKVWTSLQPFAASRREKSGHIWNWNGFPLCKSSCVSAPTEELPAIMAALNDLPDFRSMASLGRAIPWKIDQTAENGKK